MTNEIDTGITLDMIDNSKAIMQRLETEATQVRAQSLAAA